MSEQSSEYDPMSLHPGVDEIYTSPRMIEHARLMRSISQASNPKHDSKRTVEIINKPDLFGEYDDNPQTTNNPPVANEE
jgi:hypothetical protein